MTQNNISRERIVTEDYRTWREGFPEMNDISVTLVGVVTSGTSPDPQYFPRRTVAVTNLRIGPKASWGHVYYGTAVIVDKDQFEYANNYIEKRIKEAFWEEPQK